MSSDQPIGRDFASEAPKGRDFAAQSSAPEVKWEEIKNRRDYTQAMMPDGVAILQAISTYCPECRAIAPHLIKMIKKYPDARFYRYNVDVAEDVAQELGATHTPKFSVFVDGMSYLLLVAI